MTGENLKKKLSMIIIPASKVIMTRMERESRVKKKANIITIRNNIRRERVNTVVGSNRL